MKCEDCLLIIEDYFDSELDKQQTQSVAHHLASCLECSKAYQELETEQAVYSNYQRNIEISPALQSAIEARVLQTPQLSKGLMAWLQKLITSLLTSSMVTPVLTAAVLILVTVVTTIMMMKGFSTPVVNQQPVAVNTPVDKTLEIPKVIDDSTSLPKDETQPQNLTSVKAATSSKRSKLTNKSIDPAKQLIKEAEAKYLAAIAILSKDSQKNYQQLDPKLKASFDQSLQVIDQNIARTRLAIRQNPTDPVVAQYMLTAYAKKVEILQEIVNINEKFGN